MEHMWRPLIGRIPQHWKIWLKWKKPLALLICLGIAILITIVAVLLQYINSPVKHMAENLEKGFYNEAVSVYTENMRSRDSTELISMLNQRLDAILDEYYQGAREYGHVKDETDALRTMGINALSAKIKAVALFAAALNQSRTAFANAEQKYTAGDYPNAADYYEQVIGEDPDYIKALEGLEASINAIRETALADASVLAAGKNYDGAAALIEKALLTLENDAELIRWRDIYHQQKQDDFRQTALDKAKESAASGDYESAIAVLEEALLVLVNDEALHRQKEIYETEGIEARKRQALENAEVYAQALDYEQAIAVLDLALISFGEDQQLVTQRGAYKAAFISLTLEKAVRMAAQGQYDDGIELLTKTATILQDQEAFAAKILEIESQKPKPLLQVCPPQDGQLFEIPNYFEMGGVAYSNGFALSVITGQTYVSFNLSGRYDLLSFIVGHIDGSAAFTSRIRIYMDGVEQSSFAVNADDQPKSVEIPVSGVYNLTITGESILFPKIGFADARIK